MAKTPQSIIQRSVALTTTAASIYALLAAIFDIVPSQCSNIEVSADPTLTNQDVFCGDALVSSTNMAFRITASSQDIWADRTENGNGISLTSMFLRAAAGTPSVNIRVRCL